ncbi:uncharacterized protein [Penaeus vannamei]|uniref:uncharacterized protein n=1 Tax=Penaeus vannamei TaxID=6689 RepID=UPI00387F7591
MDGDKLLKNIKKVFPYCQSIGMQDSQVLLHGSDVYCPLGEMSVIEQQLLSYNRGEGRHKTESNYQKLLTLGAQVALSKTVSGHIDSHECFDGHLTDKESREEISRRLSAGLQLWCMWCPRERLSTSQVKEAPGQLSTPNYLWKGT